MKNASTRAADVTKRILGIDTCGATGSLAIVDARVSNNAGQRLTVLAEAELAGRTSAARLIPTVRELLLEAQCTLAELEAIVVVHGPGSFTGIRIGVSAAKALAEAVELPLIAVSRLRVLAESHGARSAALDAGRGEFYFGLFASAPETSARAAAAQVSVGEWLLTQAEVLANLADSPMAGLSSPAEETRLVVCEPRAAEAFSGAARLVEASTAVHAIRSALGRLERREYDDVSRLDGYYLRRSDSELFRKPEYPTVPAAAAGGASELP